MAQKTITLDLARAAKEKAKALLANVPEVNGIGIARRGDDYAVKVNLETEPEDRSDLPTVIDGVRVVFHVVGRIRRQ
ncbi:MAG: hypothetical protein ACYTEZ_03615 [Planctomycetota bacterium]